MQISLNELKKQKTSNRIYILGSGKSILDITEKEWKEIEKHDTIGFNHWYVHKHKPTFYDLSYLANDYFETSDVDMFKLAQEKCPNSVFILNHSLDEYHNNFFTDSTFYKTHVNHFDYFEGDVEKIWETHTDDIGKLATYWSVDIFNHFNQPYGSLMPNEHFINKSRGQLFSTIQIAVLLGYTDIRLLGVDLNDEGKFQDHYNDAPYSAKSVGNGGEKLKARLSAYENMKDKNGVHNTCQGTTDKDYLGIHKLINIFTNKCLKNNGVFLTVCNPDSLLTKVNINYQSIIGEIEMEKITFCIPSKNNRRYLEACIPSIRKNTYRKDHDIIVFVDADNDGTVEWLESVKDEYNLKYIVNDTDELYGIGRAYDKCVDESTTDIFMIFHADMMLGKDADLEAFKYLDKKKVVCATRIEPPLHPENGEKIIRDFGMWPEKDVEEGWLEDDFDKYVEEAKVEFKDKTTNGCFAPWMMYKDDFISMGGHDPRFASAREDSDVFNRLSIGGFELIQSWQSFVYHLTARGGQFQHGKLTQDHNQKSEEWQKLMNNSTREFFRKWGTPVLHDNLLKPIVPPKYDIGFVVKNCDEGMLEALEPWCSTIYVDTYAEDYINKEQPNTTDDLTKKIYSIDDDVQNDIEVRIDGSQLNNQNFNYIVQLSQILANDEELEVGSFKLDIFEININKLKTHEEELIVNENTMFNTN